MDPCDEAQKATEDHLRQSLAKATGAGISGPGSEKCLDCGETIPEKRRLAAPGCERCVGCQQEYEEYMSWRG